MNKLQKIVFWLISFTWGLPMTLLGAVIAFVLSSCGYERKNFHGLIYYNVGESWGGFNCGGFFFVDKNTPLETMQHEAGHGIQNLMFGWFEPFIAIASAIRYWYRRYQTEVKKVPHDSLPDYDSIWFEGQATALGKKYFGN